MSFSASGIFRQYFVSALGTRGTSDTGLAGSDTVRAALFNNSVTPDKDAVVGSTGYNTGTWVTANEVTDATNWAAKGQALGSKTTTAPSSGVFMFDAADTAGGGTLSITNAYGCLIFNDTITGGTVADQGVCFNYFGGAQTVSGGTFTIVWSANGIFRVTM
ncbi:hypothetical protein [Streptomyces sp. NPDC055085]